jgi:Domain of unknown function (DUF6265)
MRGMMNRRHATAALLLIIVTAARAQSPQPRANASIAEVAWMQGTWVSGDARRMVEEHWTSPAGGAMLAVSRTIVDGRLAEFEFLRIVERGGGLVYIAQPNGQPPTDFTMTRVDDHRVTFENPQHDFPTTIRYEKRSDGTFVAAIGGARGQREMSWTFVRKNAGR